MELLELKVVIHDIFKIVLAIFLINGLAYILITMYLIEIKNELQALREMPSEPRAADSEPHGGE